MKVLILGIGNLLLTDEGIGVHAAQSLLHDYTLPNGVEVIDGGTVGLELLPLIAEADHLILLDAVNTGNPPGTIIRLDDDQVPALFRTKLSPHQVGLSDVLAAIHLTGEPPDHLTLFGVEPASLALGMELSAQVAPQLGRLMALVVAELDRLGFPLIAKTGP
jgi:hydrogenase maturation protease